ncbi:glycosyltransferase family 4 protein [Bifidobacterium sp. ESL0790]|uniref:glycosyltransferase family 4 protein n=1 Tax=Bifidobacterium sp. ESL0790 TaxID=2983233 RepID=UPI0023F7238A|nr:glycosyltransferase family 4 protein [Bifidobacterium sp. ESL0790]WEV73212.1 glycosyltransferase family 4 protein [Bifidobacterium sp. ESL0790]
MEPTNPANATTEPSIRKDPLNGRKLNVGIIAPYSFETPGGVQFHIRDFAEELMRRGHHVAVLAPGRRTRDMPLWVTTNDSSFSIPYNGSIARLSYFGFVGPRTRRWVKQGHFDIVHLHEPETPSLSHKPLTMLHHPPFVGTFHASFDPYPLALRIFQDYLRHYISPLKAIIGVSPAAMETVDHYAPRDIERDIIPNGINRPFFADAKPRPEWQGTPDAPTIGYLGRMGESRKGFAVFAKAASRVLSSYPGARFLCAGDGEADGRKILESIDRTGALASHFEFLGRISDREKARFYQSLDLYVAPQTGGESFGIVLVEAMAASCAVVASDLKAFRDVAEDGRDAALFGNEDAADCAARIVELLGDTERLERLRVAGFKRSSQYDWSVVADRVLEVYARVLS